MAPDISSVDNASGWIEYHRAYSALYREVLARRWGLGAVSIAEHIHHTAIPDASGKIDGGFSWAAYSQPSAETLLAFLSEFSELVRNAPARTSANHYLFFTLRDPLPLRELTDHRVDPVKARLRFAVDSFEYQIGLPLWAGPVCAMRAFCGRSLSIGHSAARESEYQLQDGSEVIGRLLEMIDHVHARQPMPLSELLFARSSLLMASARLGIPAAKFLERVPRGAKVAAMIAIARAVSSAWDRSAVQYLNGILEITPDVAERYIVAPGDILGRIVRSRYGVSFDLLWPVISAMNPRIKDPNRIFPGQEILLPEIV